MAQFGFISLKKTLAHQTIKMKNRSYDVNGKSNLGYVDHENNTSTEGVFSTKQGISMLNIKIVRLENHIRGLTKYNTKIFISGMREQQPGSGSPTYINDTTDVSIASHGLFKYAPRCCRKVFLSAAGLLFFLCWASTLQVSALQSIFSSFYCSLEF